MSARVLRVVRRVVAALIVSIVPLGAAPDLLGQAAPIVGSAPVATEPSTATPLVGSSFTVDVAVDLTAATGRAPSGTAPAALTAFRIPITFDRTRLQLEAIEAGSDPSFALAGLEATSVTDANATGRLTITSAQTGLAPAPGGVVSVATLTFRAVSSGGATIAATGGTVSLASAIQTSAATLFGPASIPVRLVGGGVVVQTPPALRVKLHGGPSPVTPKGQIIYSITVENSGGSPATGTTARMTLPADVTFSAVTNGGTHNAGTIEWNVGDLAAAAIFEATVGVNVDSTNGATIQTAPATAEATNVAQVSSGPVAISVSANAPIKPGMVVAAASYGSKSGTIYDVSSGTPVQFARINSGGWSGAMHFTSAGRLIAASDAHGGSLFDVASGGNLTTAVPFARGLGTYITGLTRDDGGNLYVSSIRAGAKVRKISPAGAVTLLPPEFSYPGDVLAAGTSLYVSEGATGLVKKLDLSTNGVTTHASGFTPGTHHFSGQLIRNSAGRLFVFWKNTTGVGLFDITAGGSFSATQPVTAKNAFRVDVNELAIDTRDNIYFAGDGSGATWRAPFSSGSYGATAIFASGISDTEAVAAYPVPNIPLFALSTTASANPAVSGRTLTYTITYENRGGVAATNAVLTATVPAGTSYVSSTGSGTLAGNQLTWALGSVAAGATATRAFIVTVTAGSGATLAAEPVTIAADGVAPVPATLPQLPVVTPPDLRISVTGPASVPRNTHITYSIACSNEGGSTATNTFIELVRPTGTTFVASESGVHTTPIVKWTIGTLAPGQSGVVTVVVRADTNAPATIVNNNTKIYAQDVSAVTAAPVNTTATTATPFTIFTVTPAPNPVVTGTQINTIIRYRSTTAQSNVVLTVPLPPEATFLSLSGAGTFDGTVATWNIPALAANTEQSVRLSFRTRKPENTVFSVNATISSSTAAPAESAPGIVRVRPYPSTIQPGVVISAITLGTNLGRVTALQSSGTRSTFAEANDSGWCGPLLISPNGHVYVGTNASGGAIFDITTGGDLLSATPIATNLGAQMQTLVTDTAGNLYAASNRTNQTVKKITPEGVVTNIGPVMNNLGGIALDEPNNVFYVSEGRTGRVYRVDLTTGASTIFMTDFPTGTDHYSGQIVRTRQGRMYMLWGRGGTTNYGLFDITNGGSFIGAVPVTGKNAFRIHVNQMTIGPNDDIYFAGNNNLNIYRTLFNPATQTYGVVSTWATGLGDNESIGIFPAFKLTLEGTASVSHLNRGDAVTYTFTYTNASTQQIDNTYVEIPLPANFALADFTSGGTVQNNNAIRWFFGSLGPGESGTVTISGTIDAPEGTNVSLSGYKAWADARANATGPAIVVAVDHPLAIQVSAAPDPVIAGQNITYTIKYENLNTTAATDAILRAEVPAGTSFVSATDNGAPAGNEVTWSVASIAGGSSGEVTLIVRADVPPAVTMADYTITAPEFGTRGGLPVTTSVLPLPVSLEINAGATPDPVTAGNELTYAIQYANHGGSPATPAVLRAEIPPSTQFVSSEGGGTVDGSFVVWELGTIASGAAADVTFTVSVDEGATGSITNDAIFLTSPQQSVNAAPVVTQIVDPPPPAPLIITLAAEPSPVNAGEHLTYRITVSNPADVATNGVVVTNTLPANTSLISTTGPATTSGDLVQWSLGTLQPGDSVTLAITVRAPNTAGVIVNEGALVTATSRDAVQSNSVETEVVAPAASLRVTVSGPASVFPGQSITYTIAYANDGPSSATGAFLDVPIPASTSYASSSPAATLASGVATFNLGTLSNGETGSVTLTVDVAAPVGSTIANSGTRVRSANAPSAVADTVLTDVIAAPVTFAGTVATDKPAYVVPELVQQTGTVTYTGGGSGVVGGLTAKLLTTNAAGFIIASSTETIDAITVGTTIAMNHALDTSSTPSGTYTLTYTVVDASDVEVVRQATTFSVSAPDGAKLTGTITPLNSPVPLGVNLQVHVTVANGGGIGYTPLPLEVAILDPETLEVLASAPLEFDVAANGTAEGNAAIPTGTLQLGTYPLWLTADVGGGRLLDTDSATTIAPLLTMTPDAQSIVAGSSGTLTVTLSSAPSQPVTITLASSDPATASVPASVTIAAGATSATFAVTGAGPGGPATITATLPAHLGGSSATSTVTVVLTGLLTATLEVYQGEDVAFDVSITNGGSTALNGASFAIEIRNGESGALVDTIPFTASIAAGTTITQRLSHPTVNLAAQGYEARLVWYGLVPPHLLASALFNVVEPPPLRLEAGIGTTPRVVIWSNCSPGNSGKPCTPVKPPFLMATLEAAGIPYVVTGDEFDFLAKIRSGAFSAAIIAQAGANEAKIAGEYLADIHAGIGLLLIHSSPNAMPKLAPALGATMGGKLLGPSTMQLEATPFTALGTLTLNGNGVRLSLSGAKAVATINGTPTVVYHQYGLGRTVTVPFDLELTPTADVAKLIVGSVRYVSRIASSPFASRGIVPLHVDVTTPPGSDVSITVTVSTPAGVSIVSAAPALTATSPDRWTVTLPGNTTTGFDLWVRLPDAAATYTISFSASLTGGPPIVTKTVDLVVAADASSTAATLQTQLNALKTAARTNPDVKAMTDALAQLAAIGTSTDALANVNRVLTIIDKLQGLSTSLDATSARASADRLLLYWQSRIGA